LVPSTNSSSDAASAAVAMSSFCATPSLMTSCRTSVASVPVTVRTTTMVLPISFAARLGKMALASSKATRLHRLAAHQIGEIIKLFLTKNGRSFYNL